MSLVQSWIDVVVRARREEAQDVIVLELADPNGRMLPPFSAGSHIDVEIAPGLVRQYSLCNNPNERDRYEIGVLLEPVSRGGSSAIHERVYEGVALRVSEPRNHFGLEPNARRSLLFAGGIGITPLLCMAERLHHAGADFELHYCSRTRERSAFCDRIAAAPYADKVRLYHDQPTEAPKLDASSAVAMPQAGDHLYVCGPTGFIEAILSAARSAGWPEGRLHREYFVAPEQGANTADDLDFAVRLSSDGRTFRIPAGETIAEVLERNGIDIPVSCSQGICGTCLTGILEGVPDHRDFFLTDEEKASNASFTPCCSRSLSPLLVIDL